MADTTKQWSAWDAVARCPWQEFYGTAWRAHWRRYAAVYVDGKPYRHDPRTLLLDRTEIAVVVGKLSHTIPSRYPG